LTLFRFDKFYCIIVHSLANKFAERNSAGRERKRNKKKKKRSNRIVPIDISAMPKMDPRRGGERRGGEAGAGQSVQTRARLKRIRQSTR